MLDVQVWKTGYSYLHSILQLRDDGTFRDECKQLPLDGKRQWYDEAHEDGHLQH